MPGGRLTHEERRQIAEGLASGLSYAQIARLLARPTSTISREVSRNLSPDGYRPDQAQLATSRRARRAKPARPAVPSVVPEHTYDRDRQAVQQFTTEFTELVVQTGLPRMTARVLACLYITDTGSFTADELAQRLQVSPASISTAIKYLEGIDMVRRERDPHRRRERYVVDEDLWYQAMLSTAKTSSTWSDMARHGAKVFGTSTPAGIRLTKMSQFFGMLAGATFEALQNWHEFLKSLQSVEVPDEAK